MCSSRVQEELRKLTRFSFLTTWQNEGSKPSEQSSVTISKVKTPKKRITTSNLLSRTNKNAEGSSQGMVENVHEMPCEDISDERAKEIAQFGTCLQRDAFVVRHWASS
jgi:hypothetical protein